MKDYLENDLQIGDKVILIAPGYREFRKGIITRFTEQTVFLEVFYVNNSPYSREIKQHPSQLIKLKDETSIQSN